MTGGIKSGKSSLMVSWERCARGSHGFDAETRLEITEPSGAHVPLRTLRQQLNAREALKELSLTDLKKRSRKGVSWSAESTADFQATPLQFRAEQVEGDARHPIVNEPIVVLDAPGGVVTPDAATIEFGAATDPQQEELWLRALEQARGIVVCVDCLTARAEIYRKAFERIVDRIQTARRSERFHIAIAFTKTDQLFAGFGPMAAAAATDRAILRDRLREMMRALGHEVLTVWRDLVPEEDEDGGSPDYDIACFATSVFGYVRNNGCPAYNGATSSDFGDWIWDSFRSSERGDGLDAGNFMALNWEPLCTIDPLVFALGYSELHQSQRRSWLGFDVAAGDDAERPLHSHYAFRPHELLS